MKNKRITEHFALVTGTLLLATSLTSHAEQVQIIKLPPVTVTADKTERLLEEVPGSVLVIDGEELVQQNIKTLAQLESRVPGLSFQPFGQSGVNSPVMRGLTANFNTLSTSTLLLVDGVPTLTAQGFDNRFIDVERVEVIRGPQSTLYGRNAEAGVIAIHSRQMNNDPLTQFSAGIGSRNERTTRFSVYRPLVENQLYMSASGEWTRQQGFIDNPYTREKADDRERHNLNLGLRWEPNEATDLVLRYARQVYDDGGSLWGSPDSPRAQVTSGTSSWNRSKGQTLSLNGTHTTSSGLQFHSVTAYNHYKDRVQQDTDFRPAELLYIGRDHQLRTLSQEFRLEGNLGESDWLLGMYADQQRHDLNTLSKMMMGLSNTQVKQRGHTLALFSHWNLPLSEQWSLTAGARLERNDVSIQPQASSKRQANWTHLSPKLALQYQLGPEHSLYGSISQGVRTGGFNTLSSTFDHRAFDPEKNQSYEMGLRGFFNDRRLRYSLSAYLMNIKDMQVMQMPTPGMIYITSAATAQSKGLEVEVEYLLGSGWLVQTGLAWNHTRFDRFRDGAAVYDGNRNPFAPDLNGHLSLRYDSPHGWYLMSSLVGSGKVYLDAANRYQRKGYSLINLAAGYERGDWQVSTYLHNAADKQYDAVGYQNGFVTVYSPPREAGIRLTWRY